MIKVTNIPALLLAGALAVVGASSVVGLGNETRAAFTDVATADATFTAGTVDIGLANANNDCDNGGNVYADSNGTAVATLFSTAAAKPGTISTGFLCIKNDGTLPLQWSLSGALANGVAVTGDLKAVMRGRIWSLTPAASIAAATPCIDGYDAAGAAATVDGTTQTGFGSELDPDGLLSSNFSITAAGGTALAVGGYQKICVSVVLPNTVSNSDPDAAGTIQGQTVTGTFTITGNQT